MQEHVALMGILRNAYKIVVGKPEEKRARGKPWRGWDQLRALANVVTNLRVPQKAGNFLTR
jgi:hypothetical protein